MTELETAAENVRSAGDEYTRLCDEAYKAGLAHADAKAKVRAASARLHDAQASLLMMLGGRVPVAKTPIYSMPPVLMDSVLGESEPED